MELRDRFGRVHDYLRISLTDKCNLRCSYCMPESPCFMQEKQLMSADEVRGIASVFVQQLGIRKIRLTGGEPTLHKHFTEILQHLSGLGVKLALTTNGILLDRYLDEIERAGLRSINISLDSLQEEKFNRLTRRNYYDRVIDNIFSAALHGLEVKLNVVVIRGENENEVADFIRLSRELPLHIRFIEFMPFDGNRWLWDKVVSATEMLESVKKIHRVEKLDDDLHSTSRNYRVKGGRGTFAFISTVTQPFCDGCNRIRLTADGKIRNCLFGTREWDLLDAWRKGEDIVPLVQEAVQNKFPERGGLPRFSEREALNALLSERPMVRIGG